MEKKIEFYISEHPKPLQTFAEFIASFEHCNIYIHSNHLEQAEQISNALWAVSNQRFIPNAVKPNLPGCIIQIGYEDIPLHREIIVNVSSHKLERVDIEWVYQDLETARKRYKAWKDAGFMIDTIKKQ